MPEIVIYTKSGCGYCHAAKQLLARKPLPYREINVACDPATRRHMIDRAGGRSTVPQIFFGEHHVGGSDDLYRLEESGRFDTLLAAAS